MGGLIKPARGSFFKTFVYTWAIVVSTKSVLAIFPANRRSSSNTRAQLADAACGLSSVRTALFPTALTQLYPRLLEMFKEQPCLAELLTAPVLLLLNSSWRIQFALYGASAALLHSGQGSRWRKILPPTWTLNVIGNAWLLWAFIFDSDAFPKSYEKVIMSHSTYYVPPDMTKTELETFLSSATFPQLGVPSNVECSQRGVVCSRLHPDEPSCLLNYLKACLHESRRVGKWVGAFTALTMVARQRQKLLQSPSQHAQQWLISTARGTAFVVGSINSAWALVCVLQRILPNGFAPKSRWLLNGAVASLWILILPARRQTELALYVARLTVLSLWKAWRIRGGVCIPFGEVLIFGASWAHLARLRRRGSEIGGLVGLGMAALET